MPTSMRTRGTTTKTKSRGRRLFPTIYDSLNLLLQSIGFDRSAFAARPRGAGRQLQDKESSSSSTHAKVFRSFLSKIRNYPSNETGF